MKSDIWIKEIMSLKVPNVIHKDLTKFLILFYIIIYKKINKKFSLNEVAQYIYEFYIDNPDISKLNSNSVIRNIKKYNIEDIYQIIKIALYDWKLDFSDGCLNFNENEIIVEVEDLTDKTYDNSMMIAKMLYKKATNTDFNYKPELNELNDVTKYDLDILNNSRLKNRVLEDMDYCCCCDSTEDLYIINLSDDLEEIGNKYNYVTVCKEHYELFKNSYFKFNEVGQIVIYKNSPLLNEKMHISYRIMKNRKKEVD